MAPPCNAAVAAILYTLHRPVTGHLPPTACHTQVAQSRINLRWAHNVITYGRPWYAHPHRRVQLPFKAASTDVSTLYKGRAHHILQYILMYGFV